jgi:hypothetical protein
MLFAAISSSHATSAAGGPVQVACDICLALARDVFELGDDSEILAMVREGLVDTLIIEAGNRG